MRRIIVNDRQDAQLFELAEADVFALVRIEQVNGEHSLEITTTRILEQGQRILLQDDRSYWHEYVVYGVDHEHESGNRAIGTYYCVWSVQPDLQGTRVSRMPGTDSPTTAALALDAALSGTNRWNRGTVTRTTRGGASMYDTDGWDAISTLVKTWGGELDVTIEVSTLGYVTSRKVDLYDKMGEQTAKRRFDFGADLKSVKRKIADGPLYCRITPRGKGEQTDTGGYGRKITISSVNGGKDYLENAAMVDLAKLPDGDGGWEYPTLEIENGSMETPAELKAWAQSVLDDYTLPKITYTVDVMQLAREGIDMQGVSLGDAVQVVDRKFCDGLRITGRVTAMEVDELAGKVAKLTIGYLDGGLSGAFNSLGKQIGVLTETVQQMNGGTLSTADYLTRLLDRINTEINATGGYTYITEGQGIRTYDVAVSDPLVGAEASAVTEIKGGTIRIANTRDSQGAWEWKTVFTSGHIAGELVTAAQIVTGYIGSAGDTFIDLDNHTVQLGQSSSRHVVVDSDGLEIFNVLTSIALFGVDSGTNPYVRIGSTGSEQGNVVIMTGSTSDSMSINLRRGSDTLMSMSYGLVHRYGVSSVWRGPYTTFGSRASDGSYYPGWASFVMGQECVARGPQSFSGGASCKALSPTAFTYGVGNEVDTGANSSDIGAALGRGLAVYGPMLACGTYNAWSSAINQYGRLLVGGGTSSSRSNAMVVYSDGDTVISGALTQSSDRRLKDHIGYLADDACEFVRALKPALFSMKSSGSRRLGFYAQDVQEAEPEGWGTETVREEGMSEDMPDMLALDYTAIIAPVVAYAQQLEKRIEQLESRLEEMEDSA